MMSPEKKKVFQFVGGGLIIAAAFAIMLPGFITYVAGLWRFISLIVSILLTAWLLVYIYHKLVKKDETREEERPPEQTEDNEKTAQS
jgi:UPF0716 family protein affecting phage T7 exclusion